jgi:predicted small lipoprotein YifL
VGLALFALAACASTGPTTVPTPHLARVTRDVQQWHDAKHPDCPFAAVAETRILRQDATGALERWTVAACGGRRFDYAVSVSPLPGGLWATVRDE